MYTYVAKYRYGHMCTTCMTLSTSTVIHIYVHIHVQLVEEYRVSWVRIPPEATLIFIFLLPQVSFFLFFFLSFYISYNIMYTYVAKYKYGHTCTCMCTTCMTLSIAWFFVSKLLFV